MSNFKQICYIEKDYNSKKPILSEAFTTTGKLIFRGKLTWADGKDKEGKKTYQKVNFSTFKQDVFDIIKNNVDKPLEIEGFLKINNSKDKDGDWKTFIEIQVISAKVHLWGETKLAAHFQETDNEIPF